MVELWDWYKSWLELIPLYVSLCNDVTDFTLSYDAMTNKVFEVMKTSTGCKNEIYEHTREFTPVI